MTPPTSAKIDWLLQRRDKLLCRRDGLYDSAVIDRIDAQLRDVPAGQDNRVDKALGRPCAILPVRAGYLVSQAVTLLQPETVTLMEQTRLIFEAAQPIEY